MVLPSEDFPPAPFKGFSPRALTFFRDLAEHQTKAWMDAHKEDYEKHVRAPMGSLVVDLSARLKQAGSPLRGDPKRSLFRINRDIRFSDDKRPYKTNAGMVLTRTGDKQSAGLLYFNFDPAGCFGAAGFYHPEPDLLAKMRAAIVERPAAWAKVKSMLEKHGLELSRDNALVRPPKGFGDPPPAIAKDLKLKSWVVRRALPLKAIRDTRLLDALLELAEAAEPLLRFGWSAVKDLDPEVALAGRIVREKTQPQGRRLSK